jgi:hypothetical protein
MLNGSCVRTTQRYTRAENPGEGVSKVFAKISSVSRLSGKIARRVPLFLYWSFIDKCFEFCLGGPILTPFLPHPLTYELTAGSFTVMKTAFAKWCVIILINLQN